MIDMRKILLFCILFLALKSIVFCQMLTIEAKLDSNKFLIGDQVKLNLFVTKSKSIKINFPVLTDSLAQGVEIVERNKPDTISKNGDIIKLKQTYLITSFDSGSHTIPRIPFEFLHDTITDTVFTDSILFYVNTLKVDTASKKIYDIKAPFDEPFSLMEILGYIVWGLAGLILIILGIYIYRKFKKKEPLIKIPKKLADPPHVIALRELDALKEKKLWQNNHFKKYHTELTDIIRKYIESRFTIQAMEMTSFEIINSFLNEKYITDQNISELRQLLTLADFVKFAKAQPLPDENDLCIRNAYKFVNETKPSELIVVTNDKELITEEQKGGTNA